MYDSVVTGIIKNLQRKMQSHKNPPSGAESPEDSARRFAALASAVRLVLSVAENGICSVDINYVDAFAKKLLRNSHIAIVSVPYMWPAGQCKWHKQDPVDVEELISWFGTSPVFLYKVTEPEGQLARLITIFVEGTDSEINRDFWRLDAITTSTALRSQYRERTKQSLFGKLKRFTGRVHLRHRE